MRRILLFIIAFRNTFLFIILQIVAFTAIFRFHFYQKAFFFNNANAVGSSIYHTQTKWKNYFLLQEQNEKLLSQNQALLGIKKDQINDYDSARWTSKINTSNFEIYTAHIVYNTTNRPINTFVIHKGEKDSMIKGMGIATAGGIAGKIIEVYDNYSLCLSILNVKNPMTFSDKYAFISLSLRIA